MKTLPLAVLVHEGPIARAYLSRMNQAGLRPGAIILMVYSHKTGVKTPVGRWLPDHSSLVCGKIPGIVTQLLAPPTETDPSTPLRLDS